MMFNGNGLFGCGFMHNKKTPLVELFCCVYVFLRKGVLVIHP